MLKISAQDIAVLEAYRFQTAETEASGDNRVANDVLLCVETGPDGVKRLGTVQRKDVTRGEFIKSFFGCGKLAGKALSLKSLSRYLRRFDLSSLDNAGGEAAVTLHGIASRCLFYKKDTSWGISRLWKKIARAESIEIREACKRISGATGTVTIQPLNSRYKAVIYRTWRTHSEHVKQQVRIWANSGWRPLFIHRTDDIRCAGTEIQIVTEWVRTPTLSQMTFGMGPKPTGLFAPSSSWDARAAVTRL